MEEEDIYNTWDMWEFFKINCASYSQSIDKKLIDIMRNNIECNEHRYSTDAAKKLNIDEDFVELIYYILCSTFLWEYGSSPKYCWALDDEKCKDLLNKCENYYYIHWIKEDN